MTKLREEEIYDLRTLEYKIRAGEINHKDLNSYLKSLPNSESNADYLEVYNEQEDPLQLPGGPAFRPADPS